MADEQTQTPRRRRRTAAKGDRQPTEYIVLERIELPAEVEGVPQLEHRAARVAWLPVLNQQPEDGPDGEVKVFKVQGGGLKAIRTHTGEDGPDTIEGDWRAVAVSGWKGGERTRRTIRAERLPLEGL